MLAEAAVPPTLILFNLNIAVLNGAEFILRYTHLPPVSLRLAIVLLLSADHTLNQAWAYYLPVDVYFTEPPTREKLQLVVSTISSVRCSSTLLTKERKKGTGILSMHAGKRR